MLIFLLLLLLLLSIYSRYHQFKAGAYPTGPYYLCSTKKLLEISGLALVVMLTLERKDVPAFC